MVLTLTRRGYMKRINANVYHTQNKGGRGIKGMGTKDEDAVNHLLYTSAWNTVLFFTNFGRVYRLKAYEIPEANSRNSKGIAAINILPLSNGEKVNALIDLDQVDPSMNLFMVTEKGLVKKTPLHEFKNVRRNGLIAISLMEGDHLAKVRLTNGDQTIILATKLGRPSASMKTMSVLWAGIPAVSAASHCLKAIWSSGLTSSNRTARS